MQAGKLTLLVDVLLERGEALEADFLHWYGEDLRDLWRPLDERPTGLTFRRAAVLTKHLPPGSAVYRVGPDDFLWSQEVQVLVSQLDLLRHLSWQTAGDSKTPAPTPLPRPGDGERAKPRMDRAERMARIWQQRNQGGE